MGDGPRCYELLDCFGWIFNLGCLAQYSLEGVGGAPLASCCMGVGPLKRAVPPDFGAMPELAGAVVLLQVRMELSACETILPRN